MRKGREEVLPFRMRQRETRDESHPFAPARFVSFQPSRVRGDRVGPITSSTRELPVSPTTSPGLFGDRLAHGITQLLQSREDVALPHPHWFEHEFPGKTRDAVTNPNSAEEPRIESTPAELRNC